MSVHISPLTLSGIDDLPPHVRRCVFWEMDTATLDDAKAFCDREFEKEAWLSMVMLEWGTCGQTATIGGLPAGSALYAPPRSVPRAVTFPTSPVGADAVLLTSLRLEPIATEFDLGTDLVRAVVRDLVRRGVRALEAFGVRPDGDTRPSRSPDPLIRGPRGSAECGPDDCMIAASFLERFGFVLVAPHDRYPRYRLELDGGHEWKEDVESALDQLLQDAAVSMAFEGEHVGADTIGAKAHE